ncbi:hypothetical protein Tco_0233714, partial [Tanacetum coccineum]
VVTKGYARGEYEELETSYERCEVVVKGAGCKKGGQGGVCLVTKYCRKQGGTEVGNDDVKVVGKKYQNYNSGANMDDHFKLDNSNKESTSGNSQNPTHKRSNVDVSDDEVELQVDEALFFMGDAIKDKAQLKNSKREKTLSLIELPRGIFKEGEEVITRKKGIKVGELASNVVLSNASNSGLMRSMHAELIDKNGKGSCNEPIPKGILVTNHGISTNLQDSPIITDQGEEIEGTDYELKPRSHRTMPYVDVQNVESPVEATTLETPNASMCGSEEHDGVFDGASLQDEANAIFRGENDQVIQEACNSFAAIYKVKSTKPHSTTPVHSGIPNVINTGLISYINIVSNEPIMNEVPLSYATKLSPKSLTKANLRKLEANVLNDVYYDVWLPLASVHEVNDRMKNLIYSEDEVEHDENETTNYLASKLKGFGYSPKSLLDQWRKTVVDNEYDPYVDDMYKGQDIPGNIQTICDNLDMKACGRKKK